MSFHCDKLCSDECCAVLRSRLAMAQLRDAGIDVDKTAAYRRKLLMERGHDAAKIEASAAKCAIVDAVILDPAKLAELYVLALGARGFVNGARLRITHWEHPTKKVQMIGIWSPRRCENFDCDMPTARTRLLRIMSTPANGDSHDECKRVLRGES